MVAYDLGDGQAVCTECRYMKPLAESMQGLRIKHIFSKAISVRLVPAHIPMDRSGSPSASISPTLRMRTNSPQQKRWYLDVNTI